MKYAKSAAFVGHDGNSVWLDPAHGRDDDDPLVAALPELFTDTPPAGVEPPKRRPGRPKKQAQSPSKDD